MAVAYSMSDNDELYRNLYRQTRMAIRQLADSSDAPIACFTLKHIFRKAAEIDPSTTPDKHSKALRELSELLRGLQNKFCSMEGIGSPSKDATEVEDREKSDALLQGVLQQLEAIAANIIGQRDTVDHDVFRQPSPYLIACERCKGRVKPGPDITAPWRDATCSLYANDAQFVKCRQAVNARMNALRGCGAVPHDFDPGYGIQGKSDREIAQKRACIEKLRL